MNRWKRYGRKIRRHCGDRGGRRGAQGDSKSHRLDRQRK